jgi:peptidoglycan hydrolase CwlO-like protein
MNIYKSFKSNWKVIAGVISTVIVIGGIGANYATVTLQNRYTNEKLERVDKLATNHISHLQADVSHLQTDLSENKERLSYIEASQERTEKDVSFIKNCLIKRTLNNEKDF